MIKDQLTQNNLPESLRLPMFTISPEEIFKGEIPLLDVNFFNTSNKTNTTITLPNGEETKEMTSSAVQLQPIISKWYYAIRNFAIVMLLSILVYIGIRIIISSSLEDKAKYKQHLGDWLIAMCLLFFMHYIMSFSVTLTEEITKAVNSTNPVYSAIIKSESGDERQLSEYYIGNEKALSGSSPISELVEGDSIVWPTNIMGKVRIDLQLEPQEYSQEQKLMKNFSLTIVYMGLVMYTVLFLFRYLKRLLMLTFLTIIAPFMAMTYPLDKMHDNSAQGFNLWLKEYIFNLLIQPVHLVLYTVLIGSAIEFATKNVLYSLVAFGFMLQAEKIMRRLFGFEKSETSSATSAALGGALAMKGIDAISKHLKGNKNQNKGGAGQNKIAQANRKPTRNINELINSTIGGSSNSSGNDRDRTGNGNNNQNDERQSQENPSNNQSQAQNIQQQEQNQMDNAVENLNTQTEKIAQSKQAQIIEAEKIRMKNEEENKQEKIKKSKVRTLANRVANSSLGLGAQRIAGEVAPHAKYIGPKLAKSALKGLAKGTLKAGLIGAGAMVGITAGLVSDDFSNVAKYGAAGAGAGLIAGNGIPNKLSNIKDSISEAYEKEYAATHTKAEIAARMDEKALNDKERIQKYQKEFGLDKEGAQRVMREIAQQYREYGVTDDDLIIKAIKSTNLNDSEKIMVAKMASQVGGDENKYEALKEGLKDRGISSEIAARYLERIRTFNNWV